MSRNDLMLRCPQCDRSVHPEEAIHCPPIDENICPRCQDDYTDALARIHAIDKVLDRAKERGGPTPHLIFELVNERLEHSQKWGQEPRTLKEFL